jgi:hypothetical protein
MNQTDLVSSRQVGTEFTRNKLSLELMLIRSSVWKNITLWFISRLPATLNSAKPSRLWLTCAVLKKSPDCTSCITSQIALEMTRLLFPICQSEPLRLRLVLTIRLHQLPELWGMLP